MMNLSKIQVPVANGSSIAFVTEVKGTLVSGHNVTVRRVICWWSIRLVIQVDGYLAHDTEATQEERVQWERLVERALKEDMECKETIHREAAIAASELFNA